MKNEIVLYGTKDRFTKREADAIKNSESFQNIKARAAQIRAERGTK